MPPTGSFEMKKLRLAILGNTGKYLDDLEMMDGNIKHKISHIHE